MPDHPLEGIQVAITRAIHQAEEQRQSLEARGATVFHYPCIAIVPPIEIEPLDASIQKAISGHYDWLVITSVNSAYALAERLRTLGQTFAELKNLRVAAVGSSTANAVQKQLGLTVDVVPADFTADALGNTIPQLKERRVFLPQSAIAQPDLAETLSSRGAMVDAVDAYRTVVAQGGDDVPGMLWAGSVDAITFTSASAVRNFSRRLSVERATLAMLDHVCIACIGPSTADAAQQFGLTVDVMPDVHTIEGLTEALVTYFQKEVA